MGLDIYGVSGGALLEDLDEDGRLDVMVTAIGFGDQMRVFRNVDGRFADATAASGLTGLTGGLNMVTADYDNDGLLDVLVLRGAWMGAAGQFPMSLLRNRGGLRFDDVTKAAGLLRLRPSQTATWLDFDGDGLLDLFVGNESGGPAINPCELYRNNRDGTFTEIAKASGVDLVAFVKGVVSGDYDNDGDPDIFVSVAQGANLLFRNDGPGPRGSTGWRFTNVAAQAGVELPKNSFPAMFFDYDNDGWLDLFVAPYLGQRRGRRGRLPRPRDQRRARQAVPEQGRRHVRRRDPRSRPPHGDAGHGPQLRRPGQRRLARLLRRNGQPGLPHAGAEPHVPQRRRHGASRT